MKTTIFCTMISILSLVVSANAQNANVWKGGFPGHENDWNCYKNWSLGKTPDVFDKVIIPDVSTTTCSYPVIYSSEVEITSLEIQSGAMLTLKGFARILTENFTLQGTCKGCELRIWIEGDAKPMTASSGQ